MGARDLQFQLVSSRFANYISGDGETVSFENLIRFLRTDEVRVQDESGSQAIRDEMQNGWHPLEGKRKKGLSPELIMAPIFLMASNARNGFCSR